ncbi:MAG: N-methyl-L-tryptophan oxidase [Phycisphaerales bacterium]
MEPSARVDVIVLGLGGMGLAACRELARRGARVLGLDRHPLGHRLGSSHGGTRVVRMAYFEHPDYVPLLRRAFAGFERLEHETGDRILERCGVAIVGSRDSSLIAASAESAATHSIPVELLDGEALRRRLPQFFDEEGGPQRGILEPGAGFVRCERTLHALAAVARRDGAILRDRVEVRGWRARHEGIEISLRQSDGEAVETLLADRLVIAAGPWSSSLLAPIGGPPLPVELVVTRQVQAWIRPETPRLAMPTALPAWLVDRGEGLGPLYGVPIDPSAATTDPGQAMAKIAIHGEGAITEPDRVDRTVTEAEIASIESLAATHVPGLRGRVESASVCLYTNSPDGHFLIDRHPLDERVAIAAGFSGHGFKFVPVVGEALADLALDGRTDLPIGFLGLSRFG